MAKRKKKKQNSLAANIKYEVYGILIIIFSVITLAGKNGEFPGIGPVGRSLSDLSSFLAGGLYFVIPLIFIYVGLYVMVKRAWPLTWSYRKTGLLLAIMAMLITYHMILMGRMDPTGEYTAWMIIKEPFVQFSNMFNEELNTNAFLDGGGMFGALLYGILYFLFSDLGSKFIVVALFAIAFICLTGLSYVDIFTKLKQKLSEIAVELKKRLREFIMLIRGKRRISSQKNNQLQSSAELPVMDEDTIEPIPEDAVHNENEHTQFESSSDGEIPLIRDFQHPSNVSHIDEFDPIQDHEDPLKEVLVQSSESTLDASSEFEEVNTEDKPEIKKPYELPPFRLLSKGSSQSRRVGSADVKTNARKLEATLESFGVRAKVLEVVTGPAVTRYELQPDIGVKVSRIVSLTDDIALALAAKDIRMEAPIPGKSAIGIEVPNTEVSIVTMKEVMESPVFHESNSKLSIVLGRDIAGQPIIGNLAKMPHLLVAGATGSGKSVCVNGIIISILYKAKPNEVKFLMIDPKKVELNMYNGIPHLLAPVVTDPRRASLALKKVVSEMEARYELFSKSGTRNIEGYNEMVAETGESEPLPYIVVIVDELADLMMVAAKDVEDSICRLAQMARAAGIHLIIATQRPSVDVITGLIKANIPSRIAFGVSSQVDSRTILDTVGAEKLLGRGDMLFLPVGASKPVRVQGAFLSDQEVEAVVSFVKNQEEANYQEEMVPEVEEQNEVMEDVEDELFDQAVQIILEAKQASVSLLQRRMRIGYTRAARLIDSMEAKGIVGPYEGSKPREVLLTMEQYQQSRLSS